MESEVIRRVNDVVDERPVTPPPRTAAGPVTNGSNGDSPHSNASSNNDPHSNGSNSIGSPGNGSTPSIADRFADLLAPLSNRRRRGLIARLSVGYYEGWRPSRAEVTELVAEELRRSPR